MKWQNINASLINTTLIWSFEHENRSWSLETTHTLDLLRIVKKNSRSRVLLSWEWLFQKRHKNAARFSVQTSLANVLNCNSIAAPYYRSGLKYFSHNPSFCIGALNWQWRPEESSGSLYRRYSQSHCTLKPRSLFLKINVLIPAPGFDGNPGKAAVSFIKPRHQKSFLHVL